MTEKKLWWALINLSSILNLTQKLQHQEFAVVILLVVYLYYTLWNIN